MTFLGGIVNLSCSQGLAGQCHTETLAPNVAGARGSRFGSQPETGNQRKGAIRAEHRQVNVPLILTRFEADLGFRPKTYTIEIGKD